ncbi:MAG: hypothetical protein CVV27_05830 [Candidatus Melainabacteria bacterium HGW-Melainabacteria-1]|nr:MAG: hypothetical protein CVV27_05830 [Candidatus Melainabacteria bacterium HGW-Melainabacteria-1]
MTFMTSRYRSIRDRVHQLAKAAEISSAFNVSAHGYQLNPPLSEKELRSFEARHQVRLPEEYRNFLQHVGNGGAGPYYGLYPLEQSHPFQMYTDSYFEKIRAQAGEDGLFMHLHKRFPYDSRKSSENYELFLKLENEEDWRGNEALSGLLFLCTWGCTHYNVLEVTGEQPGRVWYWDMGGDETAHVMDGSFLDWYERWAQNPGEFL